jgi:hypothetical protein
MQDADKCRHETAIGAAAKPWEEVWTIGMCQRIALITMHFVPQDTYESSWRVWRDQFSDR